MMDEETLQAFAEFCVEGTAYDARDLPFLTTEESALFVRLAQEQKRLEQERISHSYALKRIRERLPLSKKSGE